MDDDRKSRFIYWFAYYNVDSPSVRYRGKYPLEYLEKNHGVRSYLVTPGYSIPAIFCFIRAYLSALLFRKRDSLIVIQRIHSGFIYSTLLKVLVRWRPGDTMYDLDDADHLEYSPEHIFHFMESCSGVFVGSHELLERFYPLNKNIVLNTSPTPDLGIRKKRKNELLHIGWIGDFAGDHKKAMMTKFFPALKDLPFNIELSIIGVGRKNPADRIFLEKYFEGMPHVHLELIPDTDWQDEKKIQEYIAEFDIGIATLLDNEPHRSKSAFKLKQYLNNGIPVLSSDIPENNCFIEHGVNGFLCKNADDFAKYIVRFCAMSNTEYMQFSNAAIASQKQFDLEEYCQTLITGKARAGKSGGWRKKAAVPTGEFTGSH